MPVTILFKKIFFLNLLKVLKVQIEMGKFTFLQNISKVHESGTSHIAQKNWQPTGTTYALF